MIRNFVNDLAGFERWYDYESNKKRINKIIIEYEDEVDE